MALIVNNNIPALMTYNTVNKTSSALQKSIQKLSTGMRINSAADDAAGLAISEKMRAQINGLDRANSNAQDGISMIQTAEGALNETHSILQRMRELSVQAANDTLTQQDRSYIQEEIDQLREEITRIGNTTQFNKKKLLDGSAAVLWSSDNLTTKAIVNGGLRTIDQFGQKSSADGNFKISVTADAGQAEVKKTDIFKIKHDNSNLDIDAVYANKVETFAQTTAADVATNTLVAAAVSGANSPQLGAAVGITTIAANTDFDGYSIHFDMELVKGAANANDSASFAVTGWWTDGTGRSGEISQTVTLQGAGSGNASTWSTPLLVDGKTFTLDAPLDSDDVAADYAVANVGGRSRVAVVQTDATNPALDTVVTVNGLGYLVSSAAVQGNTVTLGGTEVVFSKDFTDTAGTATRTVDYTATAGQQKSSFDVTDIFKVDPTKRHTFDSNDILNLFDQDLTTLSGVNLSLRAAVTAMDYNANTITLQLNGHYINQEGITTTLPANQTVVLDTTGTQTLSINGQDLAFGKISADDLKKFDIGDQFSVFKSDKTGADMGVTVKGSDGSSITYNFDSTKVTGKSGLDLAQYGFNSGTATGTPLTVGATVDIPEDFMPSQIGNIASLDTKLRDIDLFWNSEGRFLLDDPKSITITQGNGSKTSITLYADDTVGDLANKLNNAIAVNLGQGQYVDNENKFVTYVDEKTAAENAQKITDGTIKDHAETAAGTIVIRSVVSGADGTLSFAGDEDLIKALSMNTLKEAKESNYNVVVTNAHTGKEVVNERITGNKLIGLIHPNVDVVFDAMSGVNARYNKETGYFEYGTSIRTDTVLHLTDNTTVYQIGANEGEDMGVNIGDMRSEALGLNSVLVTDRESAARSITIIDNAIDKVSMQRSKLGAYQNRLEYTINNLTTASENLTSAESRIRDTDMAKEMMNFSKLQIMLQAGTSMLAQANGLNQNVLSLIR